MSMVSGHEYWEAQREKAERKYASVKRWQKVLSVAEKTAIVLFATIAAWCVAQQIKLIGAIVGSVV